jgi:hypothetical protein
VQEIMVQVKDLKGEMYDEAPVDPHA